MKRLTYEFVKEQFEKEGYTLLSKEYKNSRQKLEYVCPKGHTGTIQWHSFRLGHRCKKCSIIQQSIRRRTDYEFVKEQFEKEGYTLLSKEYRNNKQKLRYICPKGHKGTIQWNSWQQSTRCAECAGNKKKDIDYIKEQFEKEGYNLLSKEYKNCNQKLEYVCPKGHRSTIRWNDFRRGTRCAECVGLKKLTYKFVKEQFEKEGYTLLTKEYKNSTQKLEYICPKGHKGTTCWSYFKQGNRCAECAGLKPKTIEYVREQFEKEGYTLLTKKYINMYQKLEYICPKGHRSTIRWNDFQQGKRCAECAGLKKLTYEFVKEQFEKEGYTLLSKEYKNNRKKLEYICPKGHRGCICWDSFQQGHRCLECFRERITKNWTQRQLRKFKSYRRYITLLTNKNFKKYYYKINPKNLKRSKDYHLDHIYSVIDGFLHDVDPEIIASPENLQMISAEENLKKNARSYMTLARLYQVAV